MVSTAGRVDNRPPYICYPTPEAIKNVLFSTISYPDIDIQYSTIYYQALNPLTVVTKWSILKLVPHWSKCVF